MKAANSEKVVPTNSVKCASLKSQSSTIAWLDGTRLVRVSSHTRDTAHRLHRHTHAMLAALRTLLNLVMTAQTRLEAADGCQLQGGIIAGQQAEQRAVSRWPVAGRQLRHPPDPKAPHNVKIWDCLSSSIVRTGCSAGTQSRRSRGQYNQSVSGHAASPVSGPCTGGYLEAERGRTHAVVNRECTC